MSRGGSGDPMPVRLYRRALILLPKSFREARGEAMVAMLADEWREQRGLGRAGLLTRAAFDLLRTAVTERARPSGASTSGSPLSWVDVKLGLRLLAKHPGMTLVSAVGITVGVAIGGSAFGVINGMSSSSLPLEEGNRIVSIHSSPPTHLHDLPTWRTEVPAFEELGAFRTMTRNVIAQDGSVSTVSIAEITASAFRIARVPPLMGRYLLDADEREGTPNVVVIGHGLWHDRFSADPEVVGTSIAIGDRQHTVVGVMPPDFAFPLNNRLWTPLRLDPSDFPVGRAPPIEVFGRLGRRATRERAFAQLVAVGERMAAQYPETHQGIRPGVFPYMQTQTFSPAAWARYLIQLLVSLVLVVIAINVGTLVYARTVTRAGEIAVRTALGASRGRIVAQLFAEAFLLSSMASVVGLVLASVVVRRIELFVREGLADPPPFWWDFSLSPATLAYGFGLAVLAAVIIGVVPALHATGRQLRNRLQSVGSGASGPRLGATWTMLIVGQIAVAVAVLPIAMSGIAKWMGSPEGARWQHPLHEVAVARLVLDMEMVVDTEARGGGVGPLGRYGPTLEEALHHVRERERTLTAEVIRHLESRSEIAGVALVGTAPWEDPDRVFEVDGEHRGPRINTPIESASTGHRVGRSVVSPEFFEVVGLTPLIGRLLRPVDADVGGTAVVNRTFVELVLGGGDALGRRIRFPVRSGREGEDTEDAPWHTIVGVVPDLYSTMLANAEARAYLPLDGRGENASGLAVRVRGGEAGLFVRQLPRMAAEVDPMLRLDGLTTLDAKLRRGASMTRLAIVAVCVISASALLLAIAGLYALMSFTVARRRREIGIRAALGARPVRVLRHVLARAAWQLALGTAVGLGLSLGVDRFAGGEMLGAREALLLPGVAGVMMAIGVLAAWGPARRGLEVDPTEALRAE